MGTILRMKLLVFFLMLGTIISCQTAQKPLTVQERTSIALQKIDATEAVTINGATCLELKDPSLKIPVTKNLEKIYCNELFCSQYSQSEKNPYWVAVTTDNERMNSKAIKRKDDFHQDHCPLTASPKPFEKTKIDLGHMYPAEDLRYSKSAMWLSGSMLNVAAQPRTFNRGVWAQIERIVREREQLANRSWIVTGPVNPRSTEKLGDISIPARYFKVVLSEAKNGTLTAYGFLATVGIKGKATLFETTVDKVEEETGYDFFSELPEEIESIIEGPPQPPPIAS